MISRSVFPLALAGALAAVAAVSPAAHAQALPTPSWFVTGLDLQCFRTPGPSADIPVTLSQLNPVLIAKGLPPQQVIMRELEQTCVPVMKDNSTPVPAAFPFIRQIDFACYRLDAQPLPNPVPLNLTHLNPLLVAKGLPQHNVALVRPAQLCVPVAKNGVMPPPAVQALAELLDVACYDVNAAVHPPFNVDVTQLNPLLTNIPRRPMTLASSPRQLCVPVRKNQQQIPPAIRNIVEWVDLEKFTADPVIYGAVPLELWHLNPLFVNRPHEHVILQQADSLMVPVAKNGAIPPGGG